MRDMTGCLPLICHHVRALGGNRGKTPGKLCKVRPCCDTRHRNGGSSPPFCRLNPRSCCTRVPGVLPLLPLEGWRHVEVTDRHAAADYARVLKDLSDTHFSKAKKIVLVQDNLNTHKPASLYEAFPPEEARRLVERFEWHYTPKHGSWLDMAESELSVLSSQCLDRRISDKQTLTEEVAAWENSRNKKHAKADWHFTTADARVKLKRLYPAM